MIKGNFLRHDSHDNLASRKKIIYLFSIFDRGVTQESLIDQFQRARKIKESED